MPELDPTSPSGPTSEASFDSPLSAMRGACAAIRADAAAFRIPEDERANAQRTAAAAGGALALVHRALEHLEVMSVLFGDVDDDDVPTVRIPRRRKVEDGDPETLDGQDRVQDTVARARFILRHHLHRLTLGALGGWTLAIAREALRSIEESYTRLLSALGDAERAVPWPDSPAHSASDLADLRRKYTAFRWAVRPEDPPSDRDLSARLRMIAIGLARLLGGVCAASLPRMDRAMLMVARIVVRDHLRAGGAGPERADQGRKLYERLCALSNALLRINQRPPLLRHDAALLREVIADLPGPDDPFQEREAAYFLDRLRPLAGRSPALDGLLVTPREAITPGRARETLTEVLRSLDEPSIAARPMPRLHTRETLRCPTAPAAP